MRQHYTFDKATHKFRGILLNGMGEEGNGSGG